MIFFFSLLVSLKRDYLRYEKDRSSSHSKINVSPPASMWSLEAVKSTPKNIPSYMRGTIAASSKYSMNDVHDHQVVRSITRATSPSKEHSMSHSKEHSMGHSKEHSMRLGGGNMKSQVSTMNTLDAPHSAFHAHSVPATASTRTVSSTPIYQFPPHQVPPQPMSSISTIAPNQSTINSANRYNNHTIQSYDSMEASTPYHLLQPVGGMTTTPSSTDSKEKLLFILNTKFKAIAEKGLLDEATISSVMRNNEKAVEKYLQSSTSSMNTSIRSSMQPSVQPSIQPSVRTSSTNGMTKYGIVKQSPDESDFRQPVQQIEPHQLFISPAPARNRSIATENAVPVTLAPPVHQSEVVSHKIAGKSMNGMGKHPSSVVMDKEERGRSIAPSVQVYPSRRGRSEDQRSVNTAGGRLYRKKAWKVGSSMSPSKRDTSPPILLDKAHFKLLQSERGRDVNRSWSASLRG